MIYLRIWQKTFSNQEGGFPLKRLFFFCILSLVLLAGLQACDIGTSSTSPSTPTGTSVTHPTTPTNSTAQPTSTGTGSSMAVELTRTITAYYNAIEAKNYTQAYTYLDPQAIDSNGKTVTQSSFIQLAQAMDSSEGTVISFNVGVFPPGTQVIMTVMRSHLGPYHAHLNMKQENNAWKITSLDRI